MAFPPSMHSERKKESSLVFLLIRTIILLDQSQTLWPQLILIAFPDAPSSSRATLGIRVSASAACQDASIQSLTPIQIALVKCWLPRVSSASLDDLLYVYACNLLLYLSAVQSLNSCLKQHLLPLFLRSNLGEIDIYTSKSPSKARTLWIRSTLLQLDWERKLETMLLP